MELTTYFAYGSNINVSYLKHYLEACKTSPAGVQNEQRAILHGWRLRTNCVTESSGGAANIEPQRGSSVEGVAMEISPAVHKVLRAKEDWPDGYKEVAVSLELPGPPKTERTAVTYVVTEKYALPFDEPVSVEYRHLILTGAHRLGFSAAYQQYLRTLLVPFVQHKKIRLMKG